MSKTRDQNAAELAALRQRFPKPSPPAALYQCVTILLVNGYLLYLVVTGQSSPVAIAAFNLCELILLSIIAHLALIPVPKEQRFGVDPKQSIVQKIMVMALSLVWLGGIYYVSIGWDRAQIDRLRQAPNLFAAFDDMHILWPLVLSGVATAVATARDLMRWRAKGGMFVPEYALSGAPKILTLVLAPIPAVLIGEPYLKTGLAAAEVAWCVVYLAVKSIAELGILAFQFLGMPEAKDKGKAPAR